MDGDNDHLAMSKCGDYHSSKHSLASTIQGDDSMMPVKTGRAHLFDSTMDSGRTTPITFDSTPSLRVDSTPIADVDDGMRMSTTMKGSLTRLETVDELDDEHQADGHGVWMTSATRIRS